MLYRGLFQNKYLDIDVHRVAGFTRRVVL